MNWDETKVPIGDPSRIEGSGYLPGMSLVGLQCRVEELEKLVGRIGILENQILLLKARVSSAYILIRGLTAAFLVYVISSMVVATLMI